MEKEQTLALKHKLPDFWLPSLTPTYTSSGPPQSLLDIKVQTTCRAGNPSHELSLKNLIAVNFTLLSSGPSSSKSTESTPTTSKSNEEGDPMCPSCKKQLSNNTLIFRMRILLAFRATFQLITYPSLSGQTLWPCNMQDVHRYPCSACQTVYCLRFQA